MLAHLPRYVPQHLLLRIIKLELEHRIRQGRHHRRFNFNVNAYITGARADSDFDSVFSNGQCVIGSGPCLTHNAGYARFDLATNYKFPRGFSFYGRVTNLLDKQYQETIGFPALGRDYRLGLSYRFSGRN